MPFCQLTVDQSAKSSRKIDPGKISKAENAQLKKKEMSTRHPVVLRIYDLSRGMAAQVSPALLGKRIDGIWHTGVLVYGK
jgi:hypothetical protein